MSNSNNYYVLDANNCLHPGLTQEQVLAAIAQATGSTTTDVNNAFISAIVEQNKNGKLRFWRGTSAEYNALTDRDSNTYYIITDDSFRADVNNSITTLDSSITTLQQSAQQKPTIEEHTIATTAWTALNSPKPYTAKATITATATLKATDVVELMHYMPAVDLTYGWMIGGINGQTITIWALKAPTQDMPFRVRIWRA